MLYPNPATNLIPDFMPLMRFVGRVVGKALYEGILLDVPFASFFLSKVLGQSCVLSDLASLDPELYKNLMFLKNYDGDVADLALNFCITDEILGVQKDVELKSGGKDIAVSKDNRVQYIYALADYHLNQKLRASAEAFVEGLADMIDLSWIRIFNTNELRVLLSGDRNGIDVSDWRQNTQYDNCSSGDRIVKDFWAVVEKLSIAERQALLRFATSCSRPPLMGFKHLQPQFVLRIVNYHGPGRVSVFAGLFKSKDKPTEGNLPTSATCFNMLKLPDYPSQKVLEDKLKQAISSNSGFQLS